MRYNFLLVFGFLVILLFGCTGAPGKSKKELEDNTAKIKESSDLLAKYSKDYTDLLKKERDIIKVYRYNPSIIGNTTEGYYNEQCTDVKLKVSDLKSDFASLSGKVNSIDTVEDAGLIGSKVEFKMKVDESARLFELMLDDYSEWCQDNKIINDFADFAKGIKTTDQMEYYKDFGCGFVRYADDMKASQQKMLDYSKSAKFTDLSALLKKKSYPFDEKAVPTKGNVEALSVAKLLYGKFCDYGKSYADFTAASNVIKAKYTHTDDIIAQNDVGVIVSKLDNMKNVCTSFTEVEPACNAFASSYPKEAKDLSCDLSSLQTTCQIFENLKSQIAGRSDVKYSELFGEQ